jgi:hypothetical protein
MEEWNDGRVEGWDDGIIKKKKFPYAIIPLFHHSNIPIEEF